MTLFDVLWLGGPMTFAVAMVIRQNRTARALDLAQLRFKNRQTELRQAYDTMDRLTAERDAARALAADWEAEAHDQAAIALSLTDTNRTN